MVEARGLEQIDIIIAADEVGRITRVEAQRLGPQQYRAPGPRRRKEPDAEDEQESCGRPERPTGRLLEHAEQFLK